MSLYADPAFQALTPHAWRPGGLALTRRGLDLCAWASGSLVADVGCGPGGTVRLLQDLGLRVLALDRAFPEGTGGLRVCADACRLPLADAVLDGLVCECVLSLLPEPQQAVTEFARVLRPGGRALVSDVTVCDTAGPFSRSAPVSCAQGALDPQAVATWFSEVGLRLLAVEDHREAMRALAAQLLWHGVGCGCGQESRGSKGHKEGRSRPLSYHLWVVEKESV